MFFGILSKKSHFCERPKRGNFARLHRWLKGTSTTVLSTVMYHVFQKCNEPQPSHSLFVSGVWFSDLYYVAQYYFYDVNLNFKIGVVSAVLLLFLCISRQFLVFIYFYSFFIFLILCLLVSHVILIFCDFHYCRFLKFWKLYDFFLWVC